MTDSLERAFLYLLAASMLVAVAQASEPPGANLDELLALARANNPEYAGMRFDAEAAAARVVPAGALADPRLEIELRDLTRMGERGPTLLPNRVGSTRYAITQELPWFGKRALKRAVAADEARGADYFAADGWLAVAAAIKQIFAERYALEVETRLSHEMLDLMARLERIALARYEGGLAPQQDVIRAQVEQTGIRNELIMLETDRHHLQVRMNALLGRPAEASLAVPEQLRALPEPARLDLATLAARATARNPMLAAAAATTSASERNRDLTYRNRYPDFMLGVAPVQECDAIREWELMVSLNLPLQRASRRAEEREAEAMVRAAQARQDSAANRLHAELAERVAVVDAARRATALIGGSLLPQAEATFQAALAGYETGTVDFATLLDAERQSIQARLNQVRAQTEALSALAEIERIVGEDL
ncbi:MAG: TolC family protein [Gammaproteobacteria bacterium]|nr:TolC family protein [Gammaproteobacteria bacterium]